VIYNLEKNKSSRRRFHFGNNGCFIVSNQPQAFGWTSLNLSLLFCVKPWPSAIFGVIISRWISQSVGSCGHGDTIITFTKNALWKQAVVETVLVDWDLLSSINEAINSKQDAVLKE
jgi:hypothetical protein